MMASKMFAQTRSITTLRHKMQFAYQ